MDPRLARPLRTAAGLALLAGAAALFLRPTPPDLRRLKARAAELQARQDRAHAEGDRIMHAMPPGPERDAALLRVPYLTPAESVELGEVEGELCRRGRP